SSLGKIVILADFPDAEHIPKPISLKKEAEGEEKTYGRLSWNSPLFGNCEKDVSHEYDEEDEAKRYSNKNEKIDGGSNDDNVDVVVK
ncbi:13569_t:CDS:2, partial [Racocetra fulgida]